MFLVLVPVIMKWPCCVGVSMCWAKKHLLINCSTVSMAKLLLIVDILSIYLQKNRKNPEIFNKNKQMLWHEDTQPVDMCHYMGSRKRAKWDRAKDRERGGGYYNVTGGYKLDKHSGHFKFSNMRREKRGTQGGDQYNICCPIYKKDTLLTQRGGDWEVEFNDDLLPSLFPFALIKRVEDDIKAWAYTADLSKIVLLLCVLKQPVSIFLQLNLLFLNSSYLVAQLS